MVGASLGASMTIPRAGIDRGMARMQEAASALVADPDPAAMVELRVGKLEVEAGARIARALDETLGELIDTLA